LQDDQLDYTLSFQQLSTCLGNTESSAFSVFETRWLQRIDQQAGGREEAGRLMASSNPVVIPRNHQVERAIQAAFENDFGIFNELRQVLAEPFSQQPGFEHYSNPPQPYERVMRTFCGT
jgi:uncharacterized protein YdiU (UPF0061 family)